MSPDSELQTVAVVPNIQVVPLAATIPNGVVPGGIFIITTPSGEMMSVTCPPTSNPGDIIQVMVPITAPPVLLGVLETETHVTFGKVSSDASGQTLRSDTLRCVTSRAVRGSSGSPIGTLQYTLQSTTENVRKAPFNVQLRSPEGRVLLQYQLPPYDTWCESPALLNVSTGGVVYASCSIESAGNCRHQREFSVRA